MIWYFAAHPWVFVAGWATLIVLAGFFCWLAGFQHGRRTGYEEGCGEPDPEPLAPLPAAEPFPVSWERAPSLSRPGREVTAGVCRDASEDRAGPGQEDVGAAIVPQAASRRPSRPEEPPAAPAGPVGRVQISSGLPGEAQDSPSGNESGCALHHRSPTTTAPSDLTAVMDAIAEPRYPTPFPHGLEPTRKAGPATLVRAWYTLADAKMLAGLPSDWTRWPR